MAGRYVRRLSTMERSALVINEIHRYHVDAVIEGIGEVDPQALQIAVDRAAEANPGIRVRLKGFLGFSRWVDSGVSPLVRLMPLSDWDGNSELGAPFLNERLDPLHGGPVSDILVVPCKGGWTRLVFRTAHAAVDGRGLIHWGTEVFRAMRGEALLGSHSTITDLDVLAQHRDRIPELPKSAPACIPVLAPAESGRELRYIWRRVVINRNVSQLLPKTAAFLAAWARRNQQGEVCFTIPVDYRGLRTQEMSIGNLTGYLRLDVPDGASPRAIMQLINRGIREFHDCRSFPRLMLWIPIWYMERRLRRSADTLLYTVTPGSPSAGIVSMGSVKPEIAAVPGFQPKLINGIPGSVGKLNVVFLAHPEVTTITFSAPAAYNEHGQLDELASAYKEYFSRSGPPAATATHGDGGR